MKLIELFEYVTHRHCSVEKEPCFSEAVDLVKNYMDKGANFHEAVMMIKNKLGHTWVNKFYMDLRDHFSIVTEDVDFKIIHKSWIKNGKVHPTGDELHEPYIKERPEIFGTSDAYEAIENGWVRATYEMLNGKKTFHVEGTKARDAARAVKYYIDKFPEIQNVNVDTEDQGSYELKGELIDKFARTGIIPRNAEPLFVG